MLPALQAAFQRLFSRVVVFGHFECVAHLIESIGQFGELVHGFLVVFEDVPALRLRDQ
jgi:hypothetical protein